MKSTSGCFVFLLLCFFLQLFLEHYDWKQPPGELIEVNSIKIHLECVGTNGSETTVILDAGLPFSTISFKNVLKLFDEKDLHVEVCAFDRPGYAWSDTGKNPRDSESIADELHQLLHIAGKKPPYVIAGWSYGGLNTQLFASRYPAEVKGIVLIDASHPNITMDPEFITALYTGMVSFKIVWFMNWFALPRFMQPLADKIPLFPSESGYPDSSVPEDIAEQTKKLFFKRSFANTAFEELYSFEDSCKQVKKSLPSKTPFGNTPLVVLAAEDSQQDPLQKDFLHWSKNSKFLVAQGSDHYIPYTKPEAIVDAVMQCIGMSRNTSL